MATTSVQSEPSPVRAMGSEIVYQNKVIGEMSTSGRITSLLALCLTFPVSFCCGFTTIQPKREMLISYWGKPTEILEEPGTYYRNPCCLSTKEFSSAIKDTSVANCKINDINGSPVVVSALVNWRISDAQKALFNTGDLPQFILDQALPVIRNIVSRYPYDADDPQKDCLRRPTVQMMEHLVKELQHKVGVVGVEVIQFQFTELRFADEMAATLLARQEAIAHVNAKRAVAESVADISLATIARLEEKSGVKFTDEEKKAAATKLLFILSNQSGATLNLVQT